MDREQAITIIKNVCESFRGNLQDHQQIQAALQVLLTPVKEDVKETEPTDE
jgi:hypothetical protein